MPDALRVQLLIVGFVGFAIVVFIISGIWYLLDRKWARERAAYEALAPNAKLLYWLERISGHMVAFDMLAQISLFLLFTSMVVSIVVTCLSCIFSTVFISFITMLLKQLSKDLQEILYELGM